MSDLCARPSAKIRVVDVKTPRILFRFLKSVRATLCGDRRGRC